MTSGSTTRCRDCRHWDADNQVASSQKENITMSTCALATENDYSAPMVIGHHRHPEAGPQCQAYLITRSDFSCTAARRRADAAVGVDEDDEVVESNAPNFAGKMAGAGASTALWIADVTLDYMLRRRQDERTIRPTKKKTFPPRVKIQLLNEQNRQCMYCGERKTTKTTDIDHMYPVVRGGPDERPNLQILCKPCNQRKGMQSDEEFRQRYAKLLPKFRAGQTPTPPQQPIPQKAFRQLTKGTQMANSARDFKRTKYISPRQKISGATPVAGIIVGGTFLLGTALALPSESWAGNLSAVTGLVTGFGTWAGLMLRAKVTGRFDM